MAVPTLAHLKTVCKQAYYYGAVVDWGDGSPPVAASLTPLTPYTTGVTTSGHTYTQAGAYTLTVTVRDTEGVVVDVVSPTISVSDPLSGRLSPQSDSGSSQDDGITRITTPTFIGNSSPGATVELFAAPAGSASQPGNLIATGTADGSGVWSASVPNQSSMADGTYTITAEVVNSLGTVLGAASLGTIVIDTIAPVVASVTFNRTTATAVITYQDNLGGLDLASVSNFAFYRLSARPLSNQMREPSLIRPTSISVTPGALPTSTEVVTVVFPQHGKALRAGRYLLKIDSGDSGIGVEDAAGNALDGKFSGRFPSGNGVPGSDFLALISVSHNKIHAATIGKDGHFSVRPQRPAPRTTRFGTDSQRN